MDPSQAQYGGLPFNPIAINGQRFISILGPTALQMSKPSKLSYYRGAVRSGSRLDQLGARAATVFRSDSLVDDVAELYSLLTQVDHPCVIKALGFADGVGKDINYSYLALTPFETTFSTYLTKHGPGVDQNGRFTEDFIVLISNIIDGIEELHSLGYYCLGLKGDHIAVMRQGDSISAKLWNFRKCKAGKEEVQKNCDWERLGLMIVEVGWSMEAMDLVAKIKSGQLKGQSILKHSALLTVRKKRLNVLALYFHISVYYQKEPNETQNKNELNVSEICVANLKSDLDKSLVWATPSWTHGRGIPISTKTLRGFVNQLRIFFEHDVDYIPNELSMEDKMNLKKVKDLEHNLQISCGELFWAVQMLAAELNLKY